MKKSDEFNVNKSVGFDAAFYNTWVPRAPYSESAVGLIARPSLLHVHSTRGPAAKSFSKCENLQRAGAFKIRGATNKILSLTDEDKRRGVAAFSSGNHAQAVALASREADVSAVIAMPERMILELE